MFIRQAAVIKEKGDTIVEVLIAIAVISMVLGGAYVTTNRSVQATRAAEERSVALKLTEAQVEQLKGLAKSNPTSIFGTGIPASPFCIDTTGVPVAATNAQCTLNVSGQQASGSQQPKFVLSISRAGDAHTFTITNQWTNASGQISDNIRLIYRVYE